MPLRCRHEPGRDRLGCYPAGVYAGAAHDCPVQAEIAPTHVCRVGWGTAHAIALPPCSPWASAERRHEPCSALTSMVWVCEPRGGSGLLSKPVPPPPPPPVAGSSSGAGVVTCRGTSQRRRGPHRGSGGHESGARQRDGCGEGLGGGEETYLHVAVGGSR